MCNQWSFGIDKLFHPRRNRVCDYLFMLGLKLNHVSKRGPWSCVWMATKVPKRTCPISKMFLDMYTSRFVWVTLFRRYFFTQQKLKLQSLSLPLPNSVTYDRESVYDVFFAHRRKVGWELSYAHAPGPWFNIKMLSYQYRKHHCGDKTILRPSYLRNGISYTAKTTSLYWIGAQNIIIGASAIKQNVVLNLSMESCLR